MAAIVVYALLLIALTPPLGEYMYRVYTRERIGRAEGLAYRLIGVNPRVEQTWRRYASAVVWFSGISMVLIYALMRVQSHLPLNPNGIPAVNQLVSFNTAASFTTNTNWQAYGGETTMSYLTQMLALTFQNFVSAAVGMAVLVALIRGIARSRTGELGNFWVDLVRTVLYILLPLSAVVGIILITQGVVQTLGANESVLGVQGFKQILARGPVASQIAIKQLGTNGGGFFNVNSAHPFEGGTPFGNYVEEICILWIPAALTFMYGRMVGSVKQGWAIFAVMWILMVVGLVVTVPGEHSATPAMQAAGISAGAPNYEGKEIRYGPDGSSLWAVTTTDASNGSVNSMHDSFQALGMVAPMFNLGVGEVIFGGVGSGLYGMIFFVIIAVFIGGLMVGRTPEYLGKKIQAREVKLAALGILVMPITVLVLTAIAVAIPAGQAGPLNAGPHGFSEILYDFTSVTNNNGSAFAGLSANTPFYNIINTVGLLLGRFAIIVPVLAMAGSLAGKRQVAASAGTFRTDAPMFMGLLAGVILIVGALTFFPAVSLGPIVEQLSQGRFF